MEFTTTRKRKSEGLTAQERKEFEKYVQSFSTKTDCMEALNISLPTLDRVLFKGSGRPDTIIKIREAIKAIN